MNATEAINKIKTMLGLEFSVEETTESVEEKFATTELEDGTRVTNDKEGEFELGDKIYVVGDDAILSDAPAGEHTLRDGYVIVVDEEATLIEIRVPESEDVADVVEEAEAAAEEQMAEETEKTELNFEDELNTIKASIEQMLKVMEATTENFNELKNEVEAFKAAPQHKGITEKKNINQNFADYRLGILNKHRK
ncbi:MAG: hypothetical protein WAO31_04420 [Rhodoluna sp.]